MQGVQHRCRGRHGRHGALSLLCYIRWNDLGLNPESSTNSCCVFCPDLSQFKVFIVHSQRRKKELFLSTLPADVLLRDQLFTMQVFKGHCHVRCLELAVFASHPDQ